MQIHRRGSSPILVSFSGIDGAGKSTQIQALYLTLKEAGLRCRVINFWNDVARLRNLRTAAASGLFKSDKGAGTPEAPVNRRDKNVRSWFMNLIHLYLYLIDAISMRTVVRRVLQADTDVVLFDRFIYDELANFPTRSRFLRIYSRFIMKLVPMLDISYLLDADPVQARARKPEYPLEFLYENREAYLFLSELSDRITVIAPNPAEHVEREILAGLANALSQMSDSANGWDVTFESCGENRVAGHPEDASSPLDV